jgi:hypothetical protein
VRLYPKFCQGSSVTQPLFSSRNVFAISTEESVDPVSSIQYASTIPFNEVRHRKSIFSSFLIIRIRTSFILYRNGQNGLDPYICLV